MSRWQQGLEWIDERTLRERLLLFAAAAALLSYVFFAQIEELNRQEQQLQEAWRAQQAQLTVIRAQTDQLVRELAHDPAKALQRRLQQLREEGAVGQRKAASYEQTLVGGDEMVAVLRDLLAGFPSVQLVALKSLPVTPVTGSDLPQKGGQGAPAQRQEASGGPAAGQSGADGAPADGQSGAGAGSAAEEQSRAVLYRRGLEVELEGEYLTLLAYVEALEKGKWRFLWGPARFAVVEHPRVRLTITLYTLAFDPTWLEV